jgi:hypothetical protein
MSAVNKNPIIISSIVLGSVIGYFIGVASKCPTPILILVTINGTFFGYLFGTALYWKKYKALLWGAVATLIALIVDGVAGSTRVSMLDKLVFASAGLFIGFDFWFFRKQILVSGCIVGIFGFIWGMSDSLWFGHAHLEPGLLNATLSSVKGFIFGMMIGSMYMSLFGWRFMKNDPE